MGNFLSNASKVTHDYERLGIGTDLPIAYCQLPLGG